MNAPPHFFSARVALAAALLSVLAGGCSMSERRAQQAFGEYQSAAAQGNLPEARLALLRLVAAKDDVPEYWTELGKIQLQLGAFGDAFYALNRAYELKRGDVEILATLTQLALLSGNLDLANQKARQLELLAPGHPAVDLTYGALELRRGNVDRADAHADKALALQPYDPAAKVLKARILVARGDAEGAARLLEEQVASRPDDRMALAVLTRLYERFDRWDEVARTAQRVVALDPTDRQAGLTLVEAALRSGDTQNALRMSRRLMAETAPSDQVDAVLALWREHWRSPAATQEALRLARQAPPAHHAAFAAHLNEVGQPAEAARLVGSTPELPVASANSARNAIIARALALRGDNDEARSLFDQVLAVEPDHVYALRGRALLRIATGRARSAIPDAQRLISIEPDHAGHRLLLAEAYRGAGDQRLVARTLWEAFHAIPADDQLYHALRTHMQRTGGAQAATRVADEFKQQRDSHFERNFA